MTESADFESVLRVPGCGICQAPMGLAPCPHLARVDGRAVCSEVMHDRLVDAYCNQPKVEEPLVVRDNCGHYINQFVCRAPFSQCGYHTRDEADFRQHLDVTGHTGTDPQLDVALMTVPLTGASEGMSE